MSANLHLRKRDLENHQFIGLVEHSHNYLRCSQCGERLVDVMVTEPNIDVEFAYQADCPHCGDHSFPIKIKGGVHIGPVDRSMHTDVEDEGDNIYIRTMVRPEGDRDEK